MEQFPPNGGLGQRPELSSFFGAVRRLFSSLSRADHDEVEFLGTDPASLQPPQIDHQLPADGHDRFFLQGRIRASQDFLPFLHRFILGLKQDHPPDHLRTDPPKGRHSDFGNGATPFFGSGTPFAGHHPC